MRDSLCIIHQMVLNSSAHLIPNFCMTEFNLALFIIHDTKLQDSNIFKKKPILVKEGIKKKSDTHKEPARNVFLQQTCLMEFNKTS